MSFWDWTEATESQILDYMNTYGPAPPFNQHRKIASYMDLTNDSVPEISFVSGYFYIFGCKDGEYVILYRQEHIDAYFNSYYLIYTVDGNRNGIPELTLATHWWTQGGHAFAILEWDGEKFRNILRNDPESDEEITQVFVQASGNINYEDLDGDWIKEVVVYLGMGMVRVL